MENETVDKEALRKLLGDGGGEVILEADTVLDLLSECSRLASRVAGLEADVTRWQLLAGKLDCKTCTPGLASRVEELEKLLTEIGTHSGDAVCDACMVLIGRALSRKDKK